MVSNGWLRVIVFKCIAYLVIRSHLSESRLFNALYSIPAYLLEFEQQLHEGKGGERRAPAAASRARERALTSLTHSTTRPSPTQVLHAPSSGWRRWEESRRKVPNPTKAEQYPQVFISWVIWLILSSQKTPKQVIWFNPSFLKRLPFDSDSTERPAAGAGHGVKNVKRIIFLLLLLLFPASEPVYETPWGFSDSDSLGNLGAETDWVGRSVTTPSLNVNHRTALAL